MPTVSQAQHLLLTVTPSFAESIGRKQLMQSIASDSQLPGLTMMPSNLFVVIGMTILGQRRQWSRITSKEWLKMEGNKHI